MLDITQPTKPTSESDMDLDSTIKTGELPSIIGVNFSKMESVPEFASNFKLCKPKGMTEKRTSSV